MYLLSRMARAGVTFLCASLLMLSGAYAQEWVSLAPSPEAAEEIYGIASGGKLYGFGGLGPAWTPRGLVYEYDPAADQWTKKKPMALPSHHVALAGWKGKIYLAGGEMRDEKMFGAFRVVEAFDPVANRWTNLPPMAIVRHGHAGAVVGNRLHIVSGDVQSLGGVKPADVQIETDLHDALELPDR